MKKFHSLKNVIKSDLLVELCELKHLGNWSSPKLLSQYVFRIMMPPVTSQQTPSLDHISSIWIWEKVFTKLWLILAVCFLRKQK